MEISDGDESTKKSYAKNPYGRLKYIVLNGMIVTAREVKQQQLKGPEKYADIRPVSIFVGKDPATRQMFVIITPQKGIKLRPMVIPCVVVRAVDFVNGSEKIPGWEIEYTFGKYIFKTFVRDPHAKKGKS